MQENWRSFGDDLQKNWRMLGDDLQENWRMLGDDLQENWRRFGDDLQENWIGLDMIFRRTGEGRVGRESSASELEEVGR